MAFKDIMARICGTRRYDVRGPQGGLATAITLPAGFNPDTDRCPMAILMHGFCASKNMPPITYIAKALAAVGIASIRFDFDAHGRSEGKFEDMTISSEIADAKAVLEYVSKLSYVTKVCFVGHSQGGVIAGMLAGQLENDAMKPVCVAQLAPAAVLKDDAIAGQCMGVKYDASNPPEYVKVMFHKLGRKFILEAQQLPIYETSSLYSGPVCLIHGTADKIVPLACSEKYDSLYPNSSLHVLQGEGHFMTKQKKQICGILAGFLKENLK